MVIDDRLVDHGRVLTLHHAAALQVPIEVLTRMIVVAEPQLATRGADDLPLVSLPLAPNLNERPYRAA